MPKLERLQSLLAAWRSWRWPRGAEPTQPPKLVEPLTAGSNHLIYKVALDDDPRRAFVVRILQADRRTLAMGLAQEIALQRLASKAQLAPEIIFHHDDATVMHFVEAPPWSQQIDASIEALGLQLHALHQLKADDTGFDLLAHCTHYFQQIAQPSIEQAQLHQQLLAFTATTLQRFPARTLCHNDLIPENILLTARPQFIDWEYATTNHPSFDLATVLEWGQLSDAQNQRLVETYRTAANGHSATSITPYNPSTDSECLAAFRLIVRYLEWLWLLQTPKADGLQNAAAHTRESSALIQALEQQLRQRFLLFSTSA